MELVLLGCTHADAENVAAESWARERGWDVRCVAADAAEAAALQTARLLWCHAGSDVPKLGTAVQTALTSAVERGAGLVLSLLATPLANDLGARGEPPRVEVPRRWRHADDPCWPAAFHGWPQYPHIRGFQGWGDHPLFDGLQRGTFTWTARDGDVFARAVFERPRWPDGAVIAVDRSYVHLDAATAVAWEYEVGAGRVLCLGANLYFRATDRLLDLQRDTLIGNALRYVSVHRSAVETGAAWPRAERRHAPVAPLPKVRAITAPEGRAPFAPTVEVAAPDERPITLGTRHGLAVGGTVTGIQEVWLHPLCVMDGGLRLTARDVVLRPTDCMVSAGHVERRLVDERGEAWREVIAGAVLAPEFYYAVTPLGDVPDASIALELRVPLRLQWPYPAEALVPLRTEIRHERQRATVVVSGCDGQHAVVLFADGIAHVALVDDDAAPQLRFRSAPGQALRVAVRASVKGTRGLSLSLRGLDEAVREQARRFDDVRTRRVRLTSDLPNLDAAWESGCARLAAFVATAPATGSGLMAGYAASRSGWNASRPGYAWFFGRDACWSVDALLAAGMFEEAREAIDLLARTADVSGKIVHELTTSGAAHYDAADSTPLFLRAVAAYAAWTGDRETLQAWSSPLLRAFDFVERCDRDGDGLPENTGVGHGWIEMGPLGGGAVTSYVAAVWVDALRGLEPLAHAIGDDMFAARIREALRRALVGLDGLRLDNGRLALHRDAAGHLASDLTAMAAAPIALGVDASSTAAGLADLGSPRFSAPWGLRMLPSDHPRYDPTAYHAGSVWPLFSGWAALAECTLGNLDRGLERAMTSAAAAIAGGTGGFAEVLHGDTGVRAGVCSDQAWSAAMGVIPVVTGLAGVRPDALARRCVVGTALPTVLGTLTLDGLRIGQTRLACRWRRGAGGVSVTISHLSGPAIAFASSDSPRDFQPLAPNASLVFQPPDERAMPFAGIV
ncbi:MAG: amylo-alpha-1,6-glucosidase [Gemmatimonadaceae bacterium]